MLRFPFLLLGVELLCRFRSIFRRVPSEHDNRFLPQRKLENHPGTQGRQDDRDK